MKPEKYKHINFKPPSGVRREAEYGLKLRREHGRGGTAVGIARARDLSNGVELSPSTVRRMKAFFDRHASDEKAEGFRQGEKGFPSNGKIANLLWGGPSGYAFAKKVVAQMEAADAKAEGRSLRPYGSTQGIRPKVVVVHGAPCSGKSTHVWKQAGDSDIVFDYRKIAEAISGSNKNRSDLVSYCTDMRTAILKQAIKSPPESGKVWVITTTVGDDLRRQLQDIPVQYLHIEATKDDCLSRLDRDKTRHPDDIEEIRKVIEDYFSENQEQRLAPAFPNVERRFLGNFSQVEKADPNLLRVEKRSDPETGKPRTYIVGYAATFGRDSLLLGDFVERLDPSAFDIVKERVDGDGKPLETRCLFNHSPDHLLGRFPTTMRLTVDEKGLKYECLLPESRQDIEELIARGDLRGSSFSFVINDGGERWEVIDGKSVRVVTSIKSLLDCGPVVYPAYGDASVSVAKRSYEHFVSETRLKKKVPSKTRERASQLSAEMRQFLESRNCGTGSGGFQKGNTCGGGGSTPSAAKKEDSSWREGGAAGALVGGAVGGLAGLPGAAAGAVAGAVIGAIGGMYGKKSTKATEDSMKSLRVSEKSFDKAAKALGESMVINGSGNSVEARGPNVSVALMKNVPADLGHSDDPKENEKVHAQFTVKSGSKASPKSLISAAKAVKADYVSVSVSSPDQKAAFVKAGFKDSGGNFLSYGKPYDPEKSLSRRSLDRRDCGRDGSGRFGSGNECQKDGGKQASPKALSDAAKSLDGQVGGASLTKWVSDFISAPLPGEDASALADGIASLEEKAPKSGPVRDFLSKAKDFLLYGDQMFDYTGDSKTPPLFKDGGGLFGVRDKKQQKRSSDCGRDDSGRFGSGNECQKDGGQGGSGEDFLGRKPRTPPDKDTPTKTRETEGKSGEFAYKRVAEKKKDPPTNKGGDYMELNKDNLKDAQAFIDKARQGQLDRGGKDGGKADDGSGVQTWSKGDNYPWATKQVGNIDSGYFQAQHPDGRKTKKYPYSGGKTKDAMKALDEEVKKYFKRSSVVIEETLQFLRERSQK